MIHRREEGPESRSFPSAADFRQYYGARFKFFHSVAGASLRDLFRKNGTRIVLTLGGVGAAGAGYIAADWKLIAWPVSLLILSFILGALWIWIVSSPAVFRNLRVEVANLRSLVLKKSVDAETAEKLQRFFDTGAELLGSEPADEASCDDWAEAFLAWRAEVMVLLGATSREDAFLFRSAGFEHDVVILRDPRIPSDSIAATRKALTAKLSKLRLVVGRSIRAAEGGVGGLS